MTHLLHTRGLTTDDLFQLWSSARLIKQRGAHHYRHLLTNHTIAHLFYEPSTRTAQSFHLACQHLGAISLLPSLANSAIHKGESLVDTALTFVAMGASTLTLRHPDRDSITTLASALPDHVHCINAGNGDDQHPTQALADLWTLDEAGIDWRRAKIAMIGDSRYSRVVHAWCDLLPTLGVRQLHLIAPANLCYQPTDDTLRIHHHTDIRAGITDCDVILCLRQQTERWPTELKTAPSRAYTCLQQADLLSAKPHVKLLHPGPVIRDHDMQGVLLDDPRCLVAKQVKHGVIMRMAILCWLYKIPLAHIQTPALHAQEPA